MAKTKHIEISEELRSRIFSGTYSKRLPSVRRLAQEFSTSVRTMSKSFKALTEDGLIKPTNNGTLIQRYALKPSKYGVINIVFGSSPGDWKSNDILLNELKRLIRGDNFTPVLCEIVDKELFSNINYWVNSQVDGHIFIYSSFYNFLMHQLNLRGIPYVVGNWMPLNYGVYWVDFNHEQCWYTLVEQIIGRSGNRRIALVFPGRLLSERRQQRECWRAIAEHFDLPNYFDIKSCFTTDLADIAQEWVEMPEPPQIVICTHRNYQVLRQTFAARGLPLQLVLKGQNIVDDTAWIYEVADYKQLAERIWQILKDILAGKGGNPRGHLIDYWPHLEIKGAAVKSIDSI